MDYKEPQIHSLATGNNAISYNERKKILGKKPIVHTPSLITIENINQVTLGTSLVFEELDDKGVLHSCTGLQNLYYLEKAQPFPPLYIMDNHNHALYFRLKYTKQNPQQHCHVLHIDAHADLGKNNNQIQLDQLTTPGYIENFVNHSCQIGNFITPFKQIGTVTQIRTSHKLEEITQQDRSENAIILDIDLDFRALDDKIPNYHVTLLRQLIQQSQLVTIATSPFFLDQPKALRFLQQIFGS